MARYIVALGNGARLEADDLVRANLIAKAYIDAERTRRAQYAQAADLLGLDADAIARADLAVTPGDGVHIPRMSGQPL